MSYLNLDIRNRTYRTINIDSTNSLIKNGIWAYILLLFFEGSLRKWVLPSLSTPLLVIRDPLAAWLIFMSLKNGVLKANFYCLFSLLVGLVGFFSAVFIGHGNWAVAAFGARMFILQFPIIFVIGAVFTRSDVLQFGRFILIISLPLTILVALQFFSPQDAWVNRGVGGELSGSGFSGALGYFRPSGPFSFVSGNALFYHLMAVFVFYFFLNPKEINRLVLFASTIALIIVIPLSISRTILFSVSAVMTFAVFASFYRPERRTKIFFLVVVLASAYLTLQRFDFFNTGIAAFSSRFETANEHEGGLSGTFYNRMIKDLFGSALDEEYPFFGEGLGMGTNVGNMLLTGSNKGFLISEGEWGRLIGELGLLIGGIAILIRLAFVVENTFRSFRCLIHGDILPWMLLSMSLIIFPNGQWSPPTTLGFCILVGGLLLASIKHSTNAT